MYFHPFRHLGRHLEFLKTLNDDRLSSSRILNGNVLPTRIHQEKKLYTRLPGPSKIYHIRAGLYGWITFSLTHIVNWFDNNLLARVRVRLRARVRVWVRERVRVRVRARVRFRASVSIMVRAKVRVMVRARARARTRVSVRFRARVRVRVRARVRSKTRLSKSHNIFLSLFLYSVAFSVSWFLRGKSNRSVCVGSVRKPLCWF